MEGTLGFGLAAALAITVAVFYIKLRLQRRKTLQKDQEIERLRGELATTTDLMRRFSAGEDLELEEADEPG
ncbi:MAG: hypothetical protein KDN20_12625, partial [Verrucomicrobiae bacterium]|nr:hypothetical protein [Verrucomicrobiae bacterium]